MLNFVMSEYDFDWGRGVERCSIFHFNLWKQKWRTEGKYMKCCLNHLSITQSASREGHVTREEVHLTGHLR